MLNWEAIGAIGEVVGAIAVVSTLAYFAVQIRDTKRSGMSQATMSAVQLFSSWRTNLVQNTDLAVAIAKLNVGDEVNEVERILLRQSFDELLLAAAVTRSQVLEAGSLHEISADVEYVVQVFKDNPGFLELWPGIRHVIDLTSTEFVQDFEKRLNEEGLTVSVGDV